MIIGLNGLMGVGKSTAANFITAYSASPTKLIKFAAPLYDIQEFAYRRIKSVFNRPDDFVKDRKLLQWLGTEWGRGTINDNIWVDIWENEVREAVKQGFTVICDDVRFDNEAETVLSLGGIVLNIASSQSLTRITTANGIVAHASEAGIASNYISHRVENNGTEKEFDHKLRSLLFVAGVKLLALPK